MPANVVLMNVARKRRAQISHSRLLGPIEGLGILNSGKEIPELPA